MYRSSTFTEIDPSEPVTSSPFIQHEGSLGDLLSYLRLDVEHHGSLFETVVLVCTETLQLPVQVYSLISPQNQMQISM
jgi:hypothetical protein